MKKLLYIIGFFIKYLFIRNDVVYNAESEQSSTKATVVNDFKYLLILYL